MEVNFSLKEHVALEMVSYSYSCAANYIGMASYS